jgi:hypothetical protein
LEKFLARRRKQHAAIELGKVSRAPAKATRREGTWTSFSHVGESNTPRQVLTCVGARATGGVARARKRRAASGLGL